MALTIRGYYKLSGGKPCVVGCAEPPPREGVERLLDDEPPEFDHWPLEEGDKLVVIRGEMADQAQQRADEDKRVIAAMRAALGEAL